MKLSSISALIWAGILAVVVFAAQVHAEEQLVLKSKNDKQDYSTGVSIVRTLKQQGGQVNLNVVIKGMLDGLTGEKLLMSEDELLRTIAGLKMTGRDQAANKLDDSKSDAAGKETKAVSGDGQKQEQGRQEPRIDQTEQNDRLASQGFSSGKAGFVDRADTSNMQQSLSTPSQRIEPADPISPNGTVISKRNQAKLNVAERKREMQAAVFAAGK